MLRVISGLLIFIICSALGSIYAERYKNRYIQLKEAFKYITLLQNLIIFNNVPLPEALSEISKKSNEPFLQLFKNVSNNLYEGIDDDVYSAFYKEYENLKDSFYYEKRDESIFQDLFKSMGESGVYGQEKIFKLAIESLKINLEESYESAKKNIKLYRYIGVCIGAMLFIFLL